MKQASKQANHYSPAYLAVAVVLSLVFIFSITSTGVSAASKTISLDPTANTTIDDVRVGADESASKASESGVILEDPLDDRTTNVDVRGVESPHGYGWRVSFPELCSGAQLQSIRLVSNTEAQDEEAIGGIFLAAYRTDNLVLLSDYSINIGEDGSTWLQAVTGQPDVPVVDRGLGDGVNTFPAGLGYAGVLDAVWDISDYDQDSLGIYIQQWIGGNTSAQTTIQSVDLTYDDANCVSTASQASASDTSNDTTNSAQLAATGTNTDSINLIATTLLITSATTFVMKRKASL